MIYIHTAYIPNDCTYVTPGKEYPLVKSTREIIEGDIQSDWSFGIIDDEDMFLEIIPEESIFLDGKAWNVRCEKGSSITYRFGSYA